MIFFFLDGLGLLRNSALNLCMLRRHLFQPSFVSEVTAPGRSAMDSVEVAYGRQVSSLNGWPSFFLTTILKCKILPAAFFLICISKLVYFWDRSFNCRDIIDTEHAINALTHAHLTAVTPPFEIAEPIEFFILGVTPEQWNTTAFSSVVADVRLSISTVNI